MCKRYDHEPERLELGSEPFWMQDVRIAQRAIERQRLAGREAASADDRADQSIPPSGELEDLSDVG